MFLTSFPINYTTGADFNNMRDGLIMAMYQGRPYVHIFNVKHFRGRHLKLWWHYAAFKKTGANATCPSRDTSCYFLKYSQCHGPDYQYVAFRDDNETHMQLDYDRWRYNDIKPWAYQYLTRGQQWLRRAVAEFVHANANQESNS
jgi:hypothetical protein